MLSVKGWKRELRSGAVAGVHLARRSAILAEFTDLTTTGRDFMNNAVGDLTKGWAVQMNCMA